MLMQSFPKILFATLLGPTLHTQQINNNEKEEEEKKFRVCEVYFEENMLQN